jgi:UDP-N-acetylglucosamine--dolichyl-phosphate N-acetylglucosaminephosphotransferase
MTEALEIPPALQTYLVKLVGVGVVSYAAVVLLIPLASKWLPAKLSGKDLCKRGTPAGDIPM